MTTTAQSNSNTPLTVLRIDASARKTGSVSRDLTGRFIDGISAYQDVAVLTHDVAEGLPFVNEDWIGANFTPDADRSDAQRKTLALSDALIADLKAADILAIGVPIYNFGVPASLKAWVDLIARARVTFQYTQNGPEGLLKGKKAYLFVASGGVPVGSPVDFATSYMKQALAFVGITDVTIVAADKQMADAAASHAAADAQLKAAINDQAVRRAA